MNPVKNEAKKAKEEMETINPQLKLKHDPTQVLPKEGGSYRNSHNPHNLHYHYHQHHYQYLRFPYPFLVEAPVRLQRMDRLNRAGQGIQMAVRMVAGEVNIALANNRDHREPQRRHMPKQNSLPPAPANQD